MGWQLRMHIIFLGMMQQKEKSQSETHLLNLLFSKGIRRGHSCLSWLQQRLNIQFPTEVEEAPSQPYSYRFSPLLKTSTHLHHVLWCVVLCLCHDVSYVVM